MARALTAGTIAELSKTRVYPAVFVQIDFLSGPSYLWSGVGSLSWNGQTWLGVGYLGKISPLTESTAIEAVGCSLSLSGIPSALLLQALGEVRQYKTVKIWFGFLDSTGAVVVDPAQAFVGRLDVPSVEEGGETCTISLSVESRLIDLQRTRERRYTHEDQQIDYGQAVAISTISRASNVVTVTTAVAHGYDVVGQTVVIAGVATSSFNGTFPIASIPNGTQFTYAQTAANASSSGGTATVPDKGFEHVPNVQDWNGVWGKGTGLPPGGHHGGGGGGGGHGRGGGRASVK